MSTLAGECCPMGHIFESMTRSNPLHHQRCHPLEEDSEVSHPPPLHLGRWAVRWTPLTLPILGQHVEGPQRPVPNLADPLLAMSQGWPEGGVAAAQEFLPAASKGKVWKTQPCLQRVEQTRAGLSCLMAPGPASHHPHRLHPAEGSQPAGAPVQPTLARSLLGLALKGPGHLEPAIQALTMLAHLAL